MPADDSCGEDESATGCHYMIIVICITFIIIILIIIIFIIIIFIIIILLFLYLSVYDLLICPFSFLRVIDIFTHILLNVPGVENDP